MSSTALPMYKRLPFKIAAVLLLIYCLLWLLSSPIIKYVAEEPLAKMGLAISPRSQIIFNPFLTRVSISNLVLLQKNKVVAQAKKAIVEVSLHKLFVNTIQLEKFLIDGVSLSVTKDKNDIIVAGINLSSANENENDKNNTETEPEEAPTTEKPESTQSSSFTLLLSQLSLTDTVINASVDGAPHTFTIKELIINDIAASQTEQSAKLLLSSLLDNAAIRVNAEIHLKNNEGSLKSNLSVSEYSLKNIEHFVTPLKTLEGTFSFSSSPTITLSSDLTQVNLQNTELATDNITVNTANENININKLTYVINELGVKLFQGETDKGSINASLKEATLTTKKISASTQAEKLTLGSFSHNMQDLSVDVINNNTENVAKNTAQNKSEKATKNSINVTLKHSAINTTKLAANNKTQKIALNKLNYQLKNMAVAVNKKQPQNSANEIAEQSINTNIQETVLSTNGLSAYTKDQHISLGKLLYKVTGLSVGAHTDKSAKTQLTALNASSQLSLNTALVEVLPNNNKPSPSKITDTAVKKLEQNNTTQTFVAFDQLTLNNITPKLSTNTNLDLADAISVMIDSVELSDLLFSQNTSNDLPPLATVDTINITNIEGSAKALSVNEVNIEGISSDIILNQNKALANLVNFSASQAEQVSPNTPKEIIAPVKAPNVAKSAKKSKNKARKKSQKNNKKGKKQTIIETPPLPVETETPFYLTLNGLNIVNSNNINFTDNSVNPAYKRSFAIKELSVGHLSNRKNAVENETPVTLKGRSNKYANFDFGGFIKPFALKPTYHIKGQLNELSLPDVSTYMKDALKLELKSGQLNTKLDVTLIDDDIDGEVSININGLETKAANSDQKNLVKDQVGIPFNTALGMLKDGNGDLKLDVPLSGKTSSPSFGVSSFIALITKKAVMSATQDYLMTTFVPYANIVSVAMVAGEFLLKLRFEDLIYTPTQTQLTSEQDEYITQFAGLMKSRKDTRVKICAISTPADIGLTLEEQLTPEHTKTLKDIGYEREEAFKAYVVEKAEIESGRILLCAPQIDTSKNAKPRMVISV